MVYSPKEETTSQCDFVSHIAESGGKPEAFALMYFGNRDAHLNLLAVRPELQRRGIGRELYQWLEESARIAGICRIHLEMRAVNKKAYHFYKALGFEEQAQIKNYYCGRETAIRMMRDLSCKIAASAP